MTMEETKKILDGLIEDQSQLELILHMIVDICDRRAAEWTNDDALMEDALVAVKNTASWDRCSLALYRAIEHIEQTR